MNEPFRHSIVRSSTSVLCLAALTGSATAQSTDIEAFVVHPPVAATFQCSEHALGTEDHVPDALGADCVVVKRNGGPNGNLSSLYTGDGTRNEDWHGWGEPLLAPCDGVVLLVRLNPESATPGAFGPGPSSGMLFRCSVAEDPAAVQVAYIHMRDVVVEAGDTVHAGQAVARIGNNGNSFHPHVHIGAFRGEMFSGDAVPIQIRFDLAAMGALDLRAGAQSIVDAFAAEVAKARGGALADAPTVDVRNTPQLIFFSRTPNRVTVPWWTTLPPLMLPVFRTFAAGDDEAAEHLFRAVFNRFLVAHEAAHWFQAHADRRQPTLYENENAANRLAVAFWRTQPGGEAFLAELEKLTSGAADALPDPTPPGEDPVAFFGANYQTLGADPLKYGYYQFRFMREAVRDRSRLDFAEMVK